MDWGKEKKYTEIMGPIGFHDIDHEGMLVEGFDQLNMSITFYNHPYYLTHMERLGLEKDIDWIEYRISVPESMNPRIEKISSALLQKGNYKVVTYNNRKVLYKEAFEAFDLIDEAYSALYGTVPLTKEVIRSTIDAYIPLVNMDFICAIKDSEDKIVGFGIMVPSIAKALKKSNGKIFPFGIVRLLHALRGKNDTLEMFLVAVNPQLQTQGLPALILSAMLEKAVKNKIQYCETGPMLETNTKIHSLWRHFDKEQHKRRRCFIKQI